MLTLVEVAKDDRAAYRPYRVAVSSLVRLTPHLTRVTFTGNELQHFGRTGLDQRVKLLFPVTGAGAPAGGYGDIGADDPAACYSGEWYARWRALPADQRNPVRTYTVRAARPHVHEIDVEFVVHPVDACPAGPAGTWLQSAAPGAPMIVVGPDERSHGSHTGFDWHPGCATRALLVGDETALPAIASILGSLPDSLRADTLIEVPSSDDVLAIDRPPTASVTWLPRDGAPHGSRLASALPRWLDAHPDVWGPAVLPAAQPLPDVDVDAEMLWDSPALEGVADPAEGFYAWIAGEAAAVKRLRRMLVAERGIDRRRVAFMGYWRQGQPERQG